MVNRDINLFPKERRVLHNEKQYAGYVFHSDFYGSCGDDGKEHCDLLKSIRRYSRYIEDTNYSSDAVKNNVTSCHNDLDEGNFSSISERVESNQLNFEPTKPKMIDLCEFWTESSYIDQSNRKKPCYNITKKGCEFIAHKCTGRKGTVFTARYINRFHEMEHEITGKRLETKEKCQMWRIVQHHRRKTGIGRTFGR